jgi:hypothetical protein
MRKCFQEKKALLRSRITIELTPTDAWIHIIIIVLL